MIDYHTLSNFELNKLAFIGCGIECEDVRLDNPARGGDGVSYGDGANWKVFDPCCNPSDAWGLIDKLWMTLNTIVKFDDALGFGNRDMTIWQAHTHLAGGNKLRASVIVFLLHSEK